MGFISNQTGELISDIEHQMMSRAYQAAQALKKAELQVLRGQGGGRRYRVPGTYREKRVTVGQITDKNGKTRRKTRGTGEYEYHKYKRGVYYSASPPGRPPAVRTGAYRLSYKPRSEQKARNVYRSLIESGLSVNGWNLGNLLENGTSKMAPRPHDERIIQKALPEISRIYNRPFMR